MNNKGWIKLYRTLQDNPIWTCEPFTRGQAWIDLILLANHEYSYFYKRNVKINIERGQVGRSEVELADRWKWSRSKVRKFINDLEKEQQVIQHKTNITQILTIVNYDNYQKKEQQDVQQEDSSKTPKRQQQDTYKNDKNNKKDNNISADEPPEYVLFERPEFDKWFYESEFKDQHKCRALMERYKYINDIPYYYDKKEIGSLSNLLKKLTGDKKESVRRIINFMMEDEFLKPKINFSEINSLFNTIATKMKENATR